MCTLPSHNFIKCQIRSESTNASGTGADTVADDIRGKMRGV